MSPQSCSQATRIHLPNSSRPCSESSQSKPETSGETDVVAHISRCDVLINSSDNLFDSGSFNSGAIPRSYISQELGCNHGNPIIRTNYGDNGPGSASCSLAPHRPREPSSLKVFCTRTKRLELYASQPIRLAYLRLSLATMGFDELVSWNILAETRQISCVICIYDQSTTDFCSSMRS